MLNYNYCVIIVTGGIVIPYFLLYSYNVIYRGYFNTVYIVYCILYCKITIDQWSSMLQICKTQQERCTLISFRRQFTHTIRHGNAHPADIYIASMFKPTQK